MCGHCGCLMKNLSTGHNSDGDSLGVGRVCDFLNKYVDIISIALGRNLVTAGESITVRKSEVLLAVQGLAKGFPRVRIVELMTLEPTMKADGLFAV